MRLATIIIYLPHRPKNNQPIRAEEARHRLEGRATLEDFLRVSHHNFGDRPLAYWKSLGYVKCMTCLASSSIKNRQIKDFLQGNCKPVALENGRQIYGPISINGRVTHTTHKLSVFNGIYLCLNCGLKSQKRVKGLLVQCTLHRSTYGQLNVKKARSGNLGSLDPAVLTAAVQGAPSSSSSSILNCEQLEAFNRCQQAVDAISMQQGEEDEIESAAPSLDSSPGGNSDTGNVSEASSPVGLSTLLSESD